MVRFLTELHDAIETVYESKGFEMSPCDGSYEVSYAGNEVCKADFINTKTDEFREIEEAQENPSQYIVYLTNVGDRKLTEGYKSKLKKLGFKNISVYESCNGDECKCKEEVEEEKKPGLHMTQQKYQAHHAKVQKQSQAGKIAEGAEEEAKKYGLEVGAVIETANGDIYTVKRIYPEGPIIDFKGTTTDYTWEEVLKHLKNDNWVVKDDVEESWEGAEKLLKDVKNAEEAIRMVYRSTENAVNFVDRLENALTPEEFQSVHDEMMSRMTEAVEKEEKLIEPEEEPKKKEIEEEK